MSAADLDRKQELQRLKSANAQGKRLRQEMDDEEIEWEDLNADDQDILQQYDTGALDRSIATCKVPRLHEYGMMLRDRRAVPQSRA